MRGGDEREEFLFLLEMMSAAMVTWRREAFGRGRERGVERNVYRRQILGVESRGKFRFVCFLYKVFLHARDINICSLKYVGERKLK